MLSNCNSTLSSPQLNFFTRCEPADVGQLGGCGAGCTFGLGILDFRSPDKDGIPPMATAVGERTFIDRTPANIGLLTFSTIGGDVD